MRSQEVTLLHALSNYLWEGQGWVKAASNVEGEDRYATTSS